MSYSGWSIFINSQRHLVDGINKVSYSDMIKIAGYPENISNAVIIDEVTGDEYREGSSISIRDNMSMIVEIE